MAESSVLSLFIVTGVICMFYCPVLGDNKLQTGQANVSQSDICKHCLAFMQDEVNLLKNETVEVKIVAEIVKVCKILGSTVCVDNVEEYGVLFISYIADELVPSDVCNGVGFCKNKKTAATKGEQLAKPHLKSGGNPCADCEAFMTDLRNFLNNRTLEKMVVEKLKKLCKLFKSVECSNYVEDYGMAAMNYLKKHFVPKNICISLESCPRSQNLGGKQIPSN